MKQERLGKPGKEKVGKRGTKVQRVYKSPNRGNSARSSGEGTPMKVKTIK